MFLLLKLEKKYKTPSIWACLVLNRTEMLYIEMSEPMFLDVLQIYRQVSMQGTKPFIQRINDITILNFIRSLSKSYVMNIVVRYIVE